MIFRTLLSHYQKHPVQALFLLIGVIIANVLLTGTLLINAQSRASYNQGQQYLNLTPVGQLRHSDENQMINERDYISLRRQGFDTLAPVLRQQVRSEQGQALEIMGIDVFAMPRPNRTTVLSDYSGSANGSFSAFSFPPFQLWLAPARLRQLGAKNGDRIQLASGETLPPVFEAQGQQLGHRLLMDIGALQSLTGNSGKLSSILVFPTSIERLQDLRVLLPDHLKWIAREEAPDPSELTRSFHLNLAAMGLLAFVVGIFLTYNALAFSYTDRRDLIRKLRLAGVQRSELIRALLTELLLFLTLGTLIGSWLGAQMAAWLLPGVGQTLAQLYGVYISYPDSLVPSGFWLPLLMTVIAAGFCVLIPLRQALNAPMLDRRQPGWQQATVLRRDRLLAWSGFLLLCSAFLISQTVHHLWIALAGMACLLLGAVLMLPLVLRTLIDSLQKLVPARRSRLSWLLADSRWLLGPASLALMAMTLALVANSGLNTMISSFREATDAWLTQRLSANLYLRNEQRVDELESWLAVEMPDLKVAERYRTGITHLNPKGKPVKIEVVSLRDGKRFQKGVSLIQGDQDAPEKFKNNEGIYISERAWRINGWQTGTTVKLCTNQPDTSIVGVYRDYGNPQSQWLISRQLFKKCWPDQAASGLSVHGPESKDWEQIRTAIVEKFGLEDSGIINQAELKQVGLTVFDRTFAVTRALNALTLLVAGIGIFCAISAIHHHRVGQQALLSALGLTRMERGTLLLLQWGVLGLLCMVLVWPFGLALAAYLGSVVTPIAFGWSFPLQLDWQHYFVLAALAAACLVLAVVVPSLRLLYTSPAAMLREQNV